MTASGLQLCSLQPQWQKSLHYKFNLNFKSKMTLANNWCRLFCLTPEMFFYLFQVRDSSSEHEFQRVTGPRTDLLNTQTTDIKNCPSQHSNDWHQELTFSTLRWLTWRTDLLNTQKTDIKNWPSQHSNDWHQELTFSTLRWLTARTNLLNTQTSNTKN